VSAFVNQMILISSFIFHILPNVDDFSENNLNLYLTRTSTRWHWHDPNIPGGNNLRIEDWFAQIKLKLFASDQISVWTKSTFGRLHSSNFEGSSF
jgi:hypothetical protein